MLTEKIEIGFDLTYSGYASFTLDDPVQGVLDSPTYTLSGTTFFDLADWVQSVEITRGKTNNIDNFSAGEVVVELNNYNREFDPTYEAGPFYGNILPRRVVRISTNGITQFYGTVDDWNLDYDNRGNSVASFVASDGYAKLANQKLTQGTAVAELSSARLNRVLDMASVAWPAAQRQIDTGEFTLYEQFLLSNVVALDYIHEIEQSEFGKFFISKTGDATFRSASFVPDTTSAVYLGDDGSGIPYQNLRVIYGSEQLANKVSVNNGTITRTASDSASIAAYGIFDQAYEDLLIADSSDMTNIAQFLVSKYSQPQYRFDSLEVRINDLSEAQQAQILNIELGDICRISFTPNNIPPAITRYAEVIRCNHSVSVDGEHIVELGFNSIDGSLFVLDDTVFGRLDEGNTLAWTF